MKLFHVTLIFFTILVAGTCIAGCTQNQPAVASSNPASTDTMQKGNLTSNETLVAFVDSAAAYAKTNGKERALAEFSNPNGSFVQGELYIYAYDFNGTTLAHPFNPEKIGVNRLNETDAEGGLFITNLRNMARNGSGFVRFYYINPVHNRTVEAKLGYVEKINDDWFLGSGIYTGAAGTVTPESS